MASPAVTANLDNGPPLPPHLQPAQPASLRSLAGAGGEQPGGGASLQANVVQKLMFAEKALQDAATAMPALSTAVQNIVSTMRVQLGKILMSQAQQGPQENAGGVTAPAGPTAIPTSGG